MKLCSYLFFDVLLPGFCANALPAADLDRVDVRLSVSVLDAAVAALSLVTFLGALVCDKAEPEALFDFSLVESSRRVLEALEAAFGPVTFLFFTISETPMS